MTQAEEDGATRPVYYESRVIKLHLDQNTLALIDATYDALEQQSDAATIEKSKKMLTNFTGMGMIGRTIVSSAMGAVGEGCTAERAFCRPFEPV